MKLGTLIVTSLALASFGALTASADQNVCTPGYEACAYTYGYSAGNGSCDDTSSYAYMYSGAGVQLNANGEYRGVFLNYGCYSDAYWPYESSYVDAYTYSFGGSGYSYAEFYWYGYSGAFGEGCGSALYSYGMDPIPNYTDLGCSAGAPPTGLPVLP